MKHDGLVKSLYDYIKGHSNGSSAAVIPCRLIEQAIEVLKGEDNLAEYHAEEIERLVTLCSQRMLDAAVLQGEIERLRAALDEIITQPVWEWSEDEFCAWSKRHEKCFPSIPQTKEPGDE